MPGGQTNDAIFILQKMQEDYLCKRKVIYYILVKESMHEKLIHFEIFMNIADFYPPNSQTSLVYCQHLKIKVMSHNKAIAEVSNY